MATEARPQAQRLLAELVLDGNRLVARDLLRPERLAPLAAPPGTELGEGDIVTVRELPAVGEVALGRVLARAGSARSAIYRIAVAHGLSPLHSPEAYREAEAWRAALGVDDPSLVDLTALPFVSVDDRSTRDLDQALHLARADDGFVVHYALADAAHYVRPGSALFAEALARGASYYLPGLTLPMLPRSLCEGLVSLNQGEPRRALVFRMELAAGGSCRRTTVLRARVCNARKLSFQAVQRYFEDPGGSGFLRQPWRPTLDLLAEVGTLLLADARRRHVVQFHRSEVDVRLPSREHLGFAVVADQRRPVERYNEQLSLLCNVEGARLLAAARGLEQVQPIFRGHPPPDLARLEQLVAATVEAHGLEAERWRWGGAEVEALGDYLARLPSRGPMRRVARAIERQALLANQPSLFGTEPVPHFGVGAPAYARFSAPMREIVGIFTHKEMLEALADAAAAPPAAADVELRDHVVEAGNRAHQLQRQLTKATNELVLDRLLESELAGGEATRPRHRGTVMGLEDGRVHVQLDQPCLDLKLYAADLERQLGRRLTLEAHGAAMSTADGSFRLRLGDPVTLVVTEHDAGRRRWLFELEPG